MNSAKIEQTASAWIARRDRGDWTDADEVAFKKWIHASMAHRVAYLRLNGAWEQSRRLKALGAGVLPGRIPLSGELLDTPFCEGTDNAAAEALPAAIRIPTASLDAVNHSVAPSSSGIEQTDGSGGAPRYYGALARVPRNASALRRVAVALGLGVLIGVAWYGWPHGSVYRTAVGELASVPLSDGSKVTLNTDSEIRVAVTQVERRVTLDQGEAYFEVAKDARRPFVVNAGDRRVIAVGTKFSVRREGDELTVVVTEGHVRVERFGPGVQVPVAQLSAGTVARAMNSDTLIQQEPIEKAEEAMSWRQGFLVFRDTSLGEAIAEFNRYNTHKLLIDDPALASLHVGGNFRATNVDAFVRLIEQGFPVRAEQHGDQIVLKPI